MSHDKNPGLAWVTGASSGIGAAIAKVLAREGWTVCISARSQDKLDALAADASKDHKGVLHAYACDVTDKDQVRQTVEAIKTAHGAPDLVIANAGTYTPDTLDDFNSENFDLHMKLNVSGIAYALEAVLPDMRERNRGHIVMVASVAGYRGLPRALSYSTSKGAVINFAESLAIECVGTNIKVQVVNPGFIKTPLTDKNDFDMPMLMDVDVAAEKFYKGLQSRRFEITFPWAFAMMLKLVGLLPDKWYFKLARSGTKGK